MNLQQQYNYPTHITILFKPSGVSSRKHIYRHRQYQREYQRAKRSGSTAIKKPLNFDEIATAKDLRMLLSEIILEVKNSDTYLIIKARLLSYLISIGVRVIETSELESCITDHENFLLQDKAYDKATDKSIRERLQES